MYGKILVALDFSDAGEAVLEAASKLADGDLGKIHLVHILEPIAAGYRTDLYAYNFQELEKKALQLATERLSESAKNLGIPESQSYTLVGSTAAEIREVASKVGAEVIVIGSHGESGWKLLLGPTANKVLHGAECDILVVHVD